MGRLHTEKAVMVKRCSHSLWLREGGVWYFVGGIVTSFLPVLR